MNGIPFELIASIFVIIIPGYLGFNLFKIISRSYGLNIGQKLSEVEKIIVHFFFGSLGIFVAEYIPLLKSTPLLSSPLSNLIQNFTIQSVISFTFFVSIVSLVLAFFLGSLSFIIQSADSYYYKWKIYYSYLRKYGFLVKKKKVMSIKKPADEPTRIGYARDVLITQLLESNGKEVYTFFTKDGLKIRGRIKGFKCSYPSTIKIQLTEDTKFKNTVIKRGELAVLVDEKIEKYFINMIKKSILLPYNGNIALLICLVLLILGLKLNPFFYLIPVILSLFTIHMYKIKEIPIK